MSRNIQADLKRRMEEDSHAQRPIPAEVSGGCLARNQGQRKQPVSACKMMFSSDDPQWGGELGSAWRNFSPALAPGMPIFRALQMIANA